jgi:hypothetical protein
MELLSIQYWERYRNNVYRGFVWSVADVINIQLCTWKTPKANVVCTDHTPHDCLYIIHKVNKTFWIKSSRNVGKKIGRISINNFEVGFCWKILLLIYSHAVCNIYCWNDTFTSCDVVGHVSLIDHLKLRINLNQKGQRLQEVYLARNKGSVKTV